MNIPTQRVKKSFYNICVDNHFNSQKLQGIATASGVPWPTIVAMCEGKPVKRVEAEKVLTAFSNTTQRKWTLDNVEVPLLPTSGTKGALS